MLCFSAKMRIALSMIGDEVLPRVSPVLVQDWRSGAGEVEPEIGEGSVVMQM